jgi:hypothetical protein
VFSTDKETLMRLTFLPAVALAAAGVLSGCTGQSDPDQVSDALRAWHRGVGQADPGACAALTDRAMRRLVVQAELGPDATCGDILGRFVAQLTDEQRDALGELTIRRVRISGDRAEVHDADVTLPDVLRDREISNDRPTVLRRVDGRWKIDDMG